MILIQEIRSIWSKASRGGPAAALRNAVPEAAPFPLVRAGSKTGPILHQSLLYGELNGFAEPISSQVVELRSDRISIGCVKIEVSSEQLVVAYEYDYRCGGAPPRHSRPGVNLKEEVVAGHESWVRVKYNGRFSGEDWWYEKVVLNVGLFQEYEPGVFYSSKPSHEISQMAELR